MWEFGVVWCTSTSFGERMRMVLLAMLTSSATWHAVRGLSPVIIIKEWNDLRRSPIARSVYRFTGHPNTRKPD